MRLREWFKRDRRADHPGLQLESSSGWLFGDGYWLLVFVLIGACIRLYRVIDVQAWTIDPCDFPFVDEITPLVQARNLLHFEVFFYPPVAPILVGALSLPWAMLMPQSFDVGVFCRCVTIAVSLATVPVIYLIGRFWSPRVGLVGAAFFSVNMIASNSTGNVQVYSAFFVTVALYCALQAYYRLSTSMLCWLGFFLGLAITTKYFPAFLGLLLLVGLVAVGRSELRIDPGTLAERPSVRRLWVGVLLGLLTLSCLLLCVGVFYKDFSLEIFKGIYGAYPHEHSFEHHLPSILKLYDFGLGGVGVFAVLIGALLGIPRVQQCHPWEWAVGFFVRHGVWLIPIGVAGMTIVVTFVIPVLFNLNNYVKYAVWTLKAYASTDGGMFPAAKPAPSYLLAFIPENFGLPLYLLSMIGLVGAVIRRDKKLVLILIAVLPLYFMLERSSVKVNRYILELTPLLCIAAGLAIESLWNVSRMRWNRWLAASLFTSIFLFTCIYSLAWGDFFRPGRDITQETATWVQTNVARDATIGIRSSVIVDHVPQFLPNAAQLSGYRLTQYNDAPDYVLLPKLVYEVTRQHMDLARVGKGYRDVDWFPYPPPTADDLQFMEEIVSETRYALVKEIAKEPSFHGFTPGQHTIRGYTWLPEHTGAFSIQVYKRVPLDASKTPIVMPNPQP